MSNDMTDERIIDLEIRLAHQEDTLRALDEVVVGLRDQVDRLQQQVRDLAGKLRDAGGLDLLHPGNEPPPPHY